MRAKQVRSPHRSFCLYLGYTRWAGEEEEDEEGGEKEEEEDENVGGREAEAVWRRSRYVGRVVEGRRWGE